MAAHSNFTPAKVKEAIFQIIRSRLGDDFSSFSFFDLCLGSGQMALEAYSLGFGQVHGFELDHKRLGHFLKQCKQEKWSLQLHRRDFIRSVKLMQEAAPLVFFLDPPYSFWDRHAYSPAVNDFYQRLCQALHQNDFKVLGLIQAPCEFEPTINLSGASDRKPDDRGSVAESSGNDLFQYDLRRYGRQFVTILEHLTL